MVRSDRVDGRSHWLGARRAGGGRIGSHLGSSNAFSRHGVETRSVLRSELSGANSKSRFKQSSGSLADRWLRGRRGFGCWCGGVRSMDLREAKIVSLSIASSSILQCFRLPTRGGVAMHLVVNSACLRAVQRPKSAASEMLYLGLLAPLRRSAKYSFATFGLSSRSGVFLLITRS